MTGYQMKRRMAAALCAVMMSAGLPAWAEGTAPAEPQTEEAAAVALVEAIAPQYTKIQASAEVNGTSVTVYASGMSNPVIRAVLDGSDSRNMNGTSYTFENVAPGEHTVQVCYNAPDTGEFASGVVSVVIEAPKEEPETEETPEVQSEAAPVAASAEPIALSEPVVIENVVEALPPKAQTEQIAAQIEKAPDALAAAAASVSNLQTASLTEYQEFAMSASVRNGVIIVTVSGATDGKMIAIEVSGNGVNEFNGILTENGTGSGELGIFDEDAEKFAALPAGEYTVRAYYESSEDIKKTTTVTVTGSSSGSTEGSDGTGDSGNTGSSDNTGDSGNTGSSGNTESAGGADVSEAVKSFTVLPVVEQATVSVVIDGASDREIEIVLIDEDGETVASSAIIGDGTVNLGEFANGTYTVRAQYVTPVKDADGNYDFKTVTGQAVVMNSQEEENEAVTPVDIQAKIEAGKDYIIVTVTEANDQKMIVSIDGFEDKEIQKGASVRYEGLTPGESYTVEIDYIDYIEGAKKYAGTVTIEKPETLGEIEISGVTPGVNKLTVSGTATAGKQLIITTTPAAAADVYAMPGDNGVFTAEISCAAGTYTAVTAKYSADTSKSGTATGKWVVKAPAQKPTLTVDPIDTTSTTVIAMTAAGTVVEIRTSDYKQLMTADKYGIIRFSLPHTYEAGTQITFVVYYGNEQSYSQTVKVSQVLYLGTLKYGDKGDDVKTLTKRLKELGYLDESTSRYGSTVREAVRLFQRANGLDADGIAGPKTQYVLFSVSAIPYGSDTYPTLVRGDRGYALIYTLQQRLKDLGYYTIKVDGIYGSGTQRAVREFQRINGLSVTGKADNATQTLLYSSAAKPAGSEDIASPKDYVTLARSGKYKSAVVPLQKRLKALGYYSGNIDGYFGSQTYRAVRNFQKINSLTVTGVADSYTQQVLYSTSAKSYSGSTASTGTTISYRLLYWGCRGDAVKKLQQALIDAGYKSIVRTADGIFGQWTYDAVRAYQKDKGLAVDGIAGKNTQNALYGTSY